MLLSELDTAQTYSKNLPKLRIFFNFSKEIFINNVSNSVAKKKKELSIMCSIFLEYVQNSKNIDKFS